jgi:hypothetical protein
MQTGHHRTVRVVTGSDAFILTSGDDQKDIDALTHLGEQEFRLTITLHWEEYRQPTQPTGVCGSSISLARRPLNSRE